MNDQKPHEDFMQLMVRARRGDENALSELAGRYEPEVRVAARVLLGPLLRPHVDSMDLVQSIHRHLLIGLRDNKLEISSPAQLLALMLTMVRRKAAKHARRLSRRQRLTTEALAMGTWATAGHAEDDPVRSAQYNDEVRRIMSQLEGTDRRVVELRLQGYSTAEAARALSLDPDALRVRLGRLRKKLSQLEGPSI